MARTPQDIDTLLICPACGYDVTSTLSAGVDRCPECGGGVSASECLEVAPDPHVRRHVAVYLGLCALAPFATVSAVGLLGPGGLGRFSAVLSVLSVLIGYTGGTVCLLGWPTGAGWLVQRIVRRGQAFASMGVFAALAAGGAVLMIFGLAAGFWGISWVG